MPRAPKAPGHRPPGAWQGSTRRAALPPGWGRIREQVLRDAGYRCQRVEDGSRCPEPATDVDHVRLRDERELQALCAGHHASKSGREGAEARIAKHGH